MGEVKWPTRGQILEKLINCNDLCLHNQNSQTHLNPSSGSFSAIDLTLSEPSMFTDYNWRVYKDPCDSDHTEPQLKPPRWNFKRANWKSYKKLCLTTLIPESNTDQEEPIIHFTNTLISIANKTIPKTTVSPKHNKPWFTEQCKNMIREHQATLRKFKINPSSENLIKYKQQRAKTWCIIKEAKRSSWKTFTLKINSNTNQKKFGTKKKITNKNINSPINYLSQGNTKSHKWKVYSQPDYRKFCPSVINKKLLKSI